MTSRKFFKTIAVIVVAVVVLASFTIVAFAGLNNKISGDDSYIQAARNQTSFMGRVAGAFYKITDQEDILYPVITGFEPVSNGVKIKFTEFEDAVKYRVYVKNADDSWVCIGETDTTSIVHENPADNTAYVYTVRALDSESKGVSSFNEDGWGNTLLSVPELKETKAVAAGLKISWGEVQNAENYRVYVKNGKSWKYIGTTDNTYFVDENVYSGIKYTYTVRCSDKEDESFTSYFNKDGISYTYLEVPQIAVITNEANGAKVSWNKIPGAAKYRVYIKNGADWKFIGSTSGTSLIHKITTSNVDYTYTVLAVDKSGTSRSTYNKDGVENKFVAAPVLNPVKGSVSGNVVSWDAVDGAEKYAVYVKSSKGWNRIATTNKTSFTDKNVKSGVKYTYTVRCLGKDGEFVSSYNKTGVNNIYISTPKITKITNTASGAQIEWNKVAGAAKYRVYVKTSSGWSVVGNTSATSLTHKISKTNVKYTYTVRAYTSDGKCYSSFYSDGFTNLFIAPPSISSVTYSNGGYLLKWNSVPNISKYRVYRKSYTSSWEKIADVKGTQFIDKTANKSTVYMYTLRCLDNNSKLVSGYLNNNLYYYNGKLATGAITINGGNYYFTNGKLQGNRIMGSSKTGYFYVGSDGVVCNSKEIQYAVDYLMKYGKGDTLAEKFKSSFITMSQTYPYSRSYDHPTKASDLAPLAIDMFENKKGNCFRMAAVTACMARAAGYRARVVTGETLSLSGYYVPHGWTEVYVDGRWLVCDMNAQMKAGYSPTYYMMKYHYWTIVPMHRYEVSVSDGKATWK